MSLENIPDEERDRLAATMNSLLKDPTLRRETLSLVKKKNPTASIPELETDDRIREASTETEKKLKALEDKVENDRMARQWDDLKKDWKARGLDPEAVQKVMTDKKIADPETAINFMRMESQLAVPTPAERRDVGRMRMPDETNRILKDPKSATDIALAAIDELNARRAAR